MVELFNRDNSIKTMSYVTARLFSSGFHVQIFPYCIAYRVAAHAT
jgi:hypothetical protein